MELSLEGAENESPNENVESRAEEKEEKTQQQLPPPKKKVKTEAPRSLRTVVPLTPANQFYIQLKRCVNPSTLLPMAFANYAHLTMFVTGSNTEVAIDVELSCMNSDRQEPCVTLRRMDVEKASEWRKAQPKEDKFQSWDRLRMQLFQVIHILYDKHLNNLQELQFDPSVCMRENQVDRRNKLQTLYQEVFLPRFRR
jgi:hypothetical protein